MATADGLKEQVDRASVDGLVAEFVADQQVDGRVLAERTLDGRQGLLTQEVREPDENAPEPMLVRTTVMPAASARTPRFFASIVLPVPAGPRKRVFWRHATKASVDNSS